MSYWKYRAFDGQLRIQEGVLVSHIRDNEPPDSIFLSLRQQGLQGVELEQIDATMYHREVYLLKLKERGLPKSQKIQECRVPSDIPKVASSIHGRVLALVCSLLNRYRKRPSP